MIFLTTFSLRPSRVPMRLSVRSSTPICLLVLVSPSRKTSSPWANQDFRRGSSTKGNPGHCSQARRLRPDHALSWQRRKRLHRVITVYLVHTPCYAPLSLLKSVLAQSSAFKGSLQGCLCYLYPPQLSPEKKQLHHKHLPKHSTSKARLNHHQRSQTLSSTQNNAFTSN